MNFYLKIQGLVFILLLSYSNAGAEGLGSMLSPGDLAAPHSKLEGLKNCTRCHTIMGGIGDKNCAGCHKKLSARVEAGKGFHAGLKKKCIECHSDHKGRSYKMVQFDLEKFDHKKTGYELSGKHRIKCGKCHKDSKTFLGLEQKCLSCHKDTHKEELSADCLKCHTFKVWKPSLFEHNRDSRYKLSGKHASVDCKKCHPENSYKVGNYNKCVTCHRSDDKHKGELGTECARCHTENSWKEVVLDHSKTAYPLNGKHIKVTCVKCHAKGSLKINEFKLCDSSGCHKNIHKGQFAPKPCKACHTVKGFKPSLFTHQEKEYKGYKLNDAHEKVVCEKCHKGGVYKPIEYESCAASLCHTDPHKSQFPEQTCRSCHDEKSFQPSLFTHESPLYKGYKLLDAHAKVVCEKCHKGGVYKPIEYESCTASLCHTDPHKSQFPEQTCRSCHDEKSFQPSLFTHESPLYKGYKLLDAHEKVACEKCHKGGVYKPIEYESCTASLCHTDPHKSQFPDQACRSCHDEKSFLPSLFTHERPLYKGYKLLGAHAKVVCEMCHKGGAYKPVEYGKCDSSGCHRDIHEGEFKKRCASCHVEKGWKAIIFDHNRDSSYPLTGKHREAECVKCHKGKKYRIEKRECLSCHEDIHKGRFEDGCDSCHTTYDWKAKAGYHENKGFPLKGVHKQVECGDCHNNEAGYSLTGYICASCHKDSHFNQFGNFCDSCHTESEWFPFRFSHNATGMPLRGVHRVSECSQCHKNRVYRNVTAPENCYGCHADAYSQNASHVSGGYSTECLTCHESFTAWFFKHRLTLTCSQCHLNQFKSAPDHQSKGYSSDCTGCHRSTVAWIFSHNSVVENCADCHLALTPQSHIAGGWSVCEECHNSTTTWQSAHPKTSFPLNHKGTSPDDCEACHAGGDFRNSGGCIECHRRVGEKVHSTNSNSGCLECHPDGRD